MKKLMYEAGKKEGAESRYVKDIEKSLEVAAKTVEIQNESLAIEKAETYREALRDIAIIYPLDSEARKIALEALYTQGKEIINHNVSIYEEAINKAETYREALEDSKKLCDIFFSGNIDNSYALLQELQSIASDALNSKP